MLDDGTAPNKSSIIRFRCRQVSPAGQVRTANFDSLYLGMAGVPAIYIQFEDGRADHVTAAQYMGAHRMRGNLAVVSDLVGQAGRASWAQLRELEAAGHCIMNQTMSHTDLSTLTQAQQEGELTGCRDALLANGLLTGRNAENWRYMSYPSGGWNAATLAAFGAVGIRMGFGIANPEIYYGMPFGQVYMLPFRQLTLATSIATIRGYIDTAIARGMLLMFYLEGMGTDSISLETFYQFIDYLVTKKNQIYSVTADDLYRLRSGPVRVPVIR
jgi:peptidoglycan/xylan/chitin deacetylase (PgdA/CDA1 family)